MRSTDRCFDETMDPSAMPPNRKMDTIQFHCPACDKRLKVPSSAAGQRGPCPSCGEEIVGPEPELGVPPRLIRETAPPLQEIPFPVPATRNEPEPSPVSRALDVFRPRDAPPAAEAVPESPKAPPLEDPMPPTIVPAPAQVEMTQEPQRRIRRLWAAVFILSCILCTVLAFIGGYLTALSRFEVGAPIFAPPSPKPPALSGFSLPDPPPAIDPAPEEDAEPVPIDDPTGDHDSLDALKGFLNATDWETRSGHVDGVFRDALKIAAEEEGDGPIEFIAIEPTLLDGDLHHYRVSTSGRPDGFPVTLRNGENGWKVEWPAFHEFSTDRFGRFIAGELSDTGEFRVFLKPADDPQPAFAAYQLTSPVGGHTTLAYASRSAAAFAKLTALLENDQVRDDPRYQALLAQDGLPLILGLQRKTSSDGRSYVEIDRVVTVGWLTQP